MSHTKRTKDCGEAITVYNSIEVVANSHFSRYTGILKSSLLFPVTPDTCLVSTYILILPTLLSSHTHVITHLILQDILPAH